ncbi:P-loop containing nucleoside triphosphate hydrolase protein [Fennellomyces sp. T-0311]|nr:P-loop containing nucleoside triphosphate hydrolase protein [Fennellomyces sp. T-0311]
MLPKATLFQVFRRRYTTRSFKDLDIAPVVCDNLRHHFGVEQPTVAQSQFIPVIQSGHDLLLRDRTGTGKSFGIAVALASKLAKANDRSSLQTLYVVPNFELATQIGHWMRLLSGGSTQDIQANTSIPAHTLISTPARLIESIDTLPFDHLDCIVLEEADQALRLPARYAPLKKQKKRASNPKPTQSLVHHVLQRISKPQIIATSATLNRPLRHWMRMQGWMKNPTFIDITQNVEAVNERTQHYCLLVSGGEVRNIGSLYHDEAAGYEGDSKTALIESVAVLNDIEDVHNGVLFVDTSVSISDVARQLAEYGLRARDIRDYERDSADKSTKLWIATEFSARGMDISDVSHVFILGAPSSVAGYVHMAGRTGRLGPQGIRGGKVITLVEDKGRAETSMLNMYKMINAQVGHYEHVQ